MSETKHSPGTKVKDLRTKGGLAAYRELTVGRVSFGAFLKSELLTSLLGTMPGACGLFLRSKLYPCLLGSCGKGVLFGRNITLRHPSKIHLGDGVIIDDNAVIDAKGENNDGIRLDAQVFIGRGTIVYCKGGSVHLESGVNVSSRCTLFSSNALTIGRGTVIGAYSYLLSGGEYDYQDPTPFAEQNGMQTRGPLLVGANCWIGTRVTVLDAACIGEHCVIGAGSVVNRPLIAHTLAAGVPARILKRIDPAAPEQKEPS
ncbi:MAG: acyltransferase [Lentisphaerae bacterium]|nr:acyltransferase [Lentisphaerota bacterium]